MFGWKKHNFGPVHSLKTSSLFCDTVTAASRSVFAVTAFGTGHLYDFINAEAKSKGSNIKPC